MATVSQALTLQDRVSPVLDNIMRSMRSTMAVMRDMSAASEKGLGNAAYRRAQADIDAATAALNQFKTQQDKIGPGAEKAASGFAKWQSAIVTANQALGLLRSGINALAAPLAKMDKMMSAEGRLNLINDGLQTTNELQAKMYASAQRTLGSYEETVDAVAKLNLLAGQTFKSNDEAIAFAEIMNQSFSVAGAGTSEAAGAMRQMTQALASGRLMGDEFVSIRENAPLIAQAIQKYMGVSAGEMRALSSEGKITADVIKNAVFAAGDEISRKFNEMPMTFGQAMQRLKNTASFALMPIAGMVRDFINSADFTVWSNAATKAIAWVVKQVRGLLGWIGKIGKSKGFQEFAKSAGVALGILGAAMMKVIRIAGKVAEIFFNVWPAISPAVYTVAAALGFLYVKQLAVKTALTAYSVALGVVTVAQTAYAAITGKTAVATTTAGTAQHWYNSAILACPLTWIIAGTAALVAILYNVAKAFIGAGNSAETAFGVIAGWVSVGMEAIGNFGLRVAAVFSGAFEVARTSFSNIGKVFSAMIEGLKSALRGFQAMFYTAMSSLLIGYSKIPLIGGEDTQAAQWGREYADLAKLKNAENYVTGKELQRVQYESLSEAWERGKSKVNFQDWGQIDWDSAQRRGNKWGDDVSRSISKKLGLGVSEAVEDAATSVSVDFGKQQAGYAQYMDTGAAMAGLTDAAQSMSSAAKGTAKAAASLEQAAQRLAPKDLAAQAFQKYLGPKLDTVPLPKLDTAPLPKLDTVPLPKLDAAPLPKLDTVPLPKLDTMPLPKLDTVPLPKLDAAPLPKLDIVPLPKIFTDGGFTAEKLLVRDEDRIAEGISRMDSTIQKMFERGIKLDDSNIEVMRELARAEVVNRYTTTRPTVNASFGDIRETADVNQILSALENVIGMAFAGALS